MTPAELHLELEKEQEAVVSKHSQCPFQHIDTNLHTRSTV